MNRKVLKDILPRVVVERRRAFPERPDRVAIVASWGDDGRVSRSLAQLILELESGGYTVVLVRASDSTAPLVWPDGFDNDATIVRKPNLGYDFGSWATGMALFPNLLRAPYVLLANDSLVGPFASLAPMLEDFERSDTDVWGATNTLQFTPHLQSYFTGYKNGILQDRALRQFWSSLSDAESKQAIIDRYEIGLSELLHVESYVTTPWIDYGRVVEPGENPAIRGWRRLIDLGFPFVKRELITTPDIVNDGHRVPAVMQAVFGVDPEDWL